MDSFLVLHQAIFGGIAAAGFGVLFNVGPRLLLWCGAAGAVTLAVRTFCQQLGWNLEGASFAAALTASAAVQLLPARKEFSSVPLHVVGCIPMVPGSFARETRASTHPAHLEHFPAAEEASNGDRLLTVGEPEARVHARRPGRSPIWSMKEGLRTDPR